LGLAREHTKCIQNDEGLKSKLLKLLTWRDLREIPKARLLNSWSNWSNGVVKSFTWCFIVEILILIALHWTRCHIIVTYIKINYNH
jgi:hypothetical protein